MVTLIFSVSLDEHVQSQKNKAKRSPVGQSNPAPGCISVQALKTGTPQSTQPKRITVKAPKPVVQVHKQETPNQTTVTKVANPTLPHISSNTPVPLINQNMTLRWEYELQDNDQENSRLEAYKNDRRKRYLAKRNVSYQDWMKSYHSQFKTFAADDEMEEQRNSSVTNNNQSLPDVVTSSVCKPITARLPTDNALSTARTSSSTPRSQTKTPNSVNMTNT